MKKLFIFIIFFLYFCVSLCIAESPLVRNIQANANNGTITIHWTLDDTKSNEPLLLYKSTKPFISTIKDCEPLATLSSFETEYTDIANDYKEYYYAVVSQNSNIAIPTVNATATGTRALVPTAYEPKEHIIEENSHLYQQGELRGLPLPRLSGDYSIYKTEQSTIAPYTKEAVKDLTKKKEKSELLAIYAFDCDLVCPEGGDDYILFQTLRKNFAKKNFATAINDIKEFMQSNRSLETSDRAIFYLAQSKYFCSDYKSAIDLFLIVQDVYPELCQKWIQSSLDLLEIPAL